MHRFAYRNGELWCEGVRVAEAARKAGTPLYLYSYNTILDHYRKVKQAFRPVNALVCFALKSNSNLAVARTLAKAGSGFDVVSGGELRRALTAGADPRKIVFASVGKTPEEIALAVKSRILFFNVESAPELEAIEQVCQRLGRQQRVSLRMNPDVDPHTHSFITTGHGASKFGIDLRTVEDLLLRHREFPHLRFEGLHLHIGSQILEARPFREAIRKALTLIERVRKAGVPITTLNIGGGLGIVYHREKPQTAADYARSILPLLKGKKLKIILEPGRFIVGNSGTLLTQVLYIKESNHHRFAIVDAGMNDLIRPSLYGAYHEIQPVIQRGTRSSKKVRYDVVGPVCESGDFLAKNRPLPPLESGDLLAIMGAGAYGFVMSSNYNSRPRAAEVLVRGNRWHVIRSRETQRDLTRGETIPAFLR
ncbi:MAG: diaminopimelate decarboxylase [Candidatus Omnitrophica bacterium]|nr:diaminopimelate decarboxylase [Candidatus Omnitrophota bacterium]